MPKKIDYTGFENEYLKVEKEADEEKKAKINLNNKNKQNYWLCICKNCKKEFYVSSQNIKKIKSCGCSRRYKDAEKEIGNKYGRLTIIEIDYERTDYEYSLGKHVGVFYKCKCDCGAVKTYRLNSIKYGHIKSCGCSKINNPLIVEDLIGQKFGRLTVIERDMDRYYKDKSEGKTISNAAWICRCDCGNKTSVRSYQLKSGRTKSCGCLVSEIITKRNKELSSKYNCPEKYKSNINEYSDSVIKVYDKNKQNFFIVDSEDYEYISKWYWRKISNEKEPNPRKRYWVTNAHKEDVDNGSCTTLRLHQIIADRKYNGYNKFEYMPDHLNRNPDDNTRKNLCLKTNMENSHNRGLSRSNTSGKTGVRFDKSKNKWQAYITVDYKTYHLGYFNTFDEAITSRKDAENKYGFTCDDIFPQPIDSENQLCNQQLNNISRKI